MLKDDKLSLSWIATGDWEGWGHINTDANTIRHGTW